MPSFAEKIEAKRTSMAEKFPAGSFSDDFLAALVRVDQMKEGNVDPGKTLQLQLYARFRVATSDPVPEATGWLDLAGSAKKKAYDEYIENENSKPDAAKAQADYVAVLNGILKDKKYNFETNSF